MHSTGDRSRILRVGLGAGLVELKIMKLKGTRKFSSRMPTSPPPGRCRHTREEWRRGSADPPPGADALPLEADPLGDRPPRRQTPLETDPPGGRPPWRQTFLEADPP